MSINHKASLIYPYIIQKFDKMKDSLTYLMRMPIDFRKAWVNASVFPISKEKISEPAIAVNGVSAPNDWAIPVCYISSIIYERSFSWYKISVMTTPESFESKNLIFVKFWTSISILVNFYYENDTTRIVKKYT